jgi:flagellar hook-length control protein FliK
MIQMIPFLQETEMNMQQQKLNPSEKESAQFMNDFALLLTVLLGDKIPKEQPVMPTENAISRQVSHLSDIVLTAEEELEVPLEEPIPDPDQQSDSAEGLKGQKNLGELEEVEEISVPLDDPPNLTGEEVVVSAQSMPQPIIVDNEIETEDEAIRTISSHPPDDSMQIRNVLEKVEPLSLIEKALHVRDEIPMQGLPLIPNDELTTAVKADEKTVGDLIFQHDESKYPSPKSLRSEIDESLTQVLLQNNRHQTIPPQRVGGEDVLVEMIQSTDELVEGQTLSLSSLEINELQEGFQELSVEPNEELKTRSSLPFSNTDHLVTKRPETRSIGRQNTLLKADVLLKEIEETDGTLTEVESETSTSDSQNLISEAEHGETTDTEKLGQESPQQDVERESKPKQAEGKQWKPLEMSAALHSPSTITHEPSVDSLQESRQTWTFQETLLDLEATQKIVPKLTERLQTLISEERSEVRIQLKPESLGELKIKLSLEQGVVSAEFVVESETVREVVAANLPQLRSTLQDIGTNVAQLAVSINTGKKDSQDDPAQRLWERKVFNAKRGPRGIGTRLEAGAVFAEKKRSWNQVDLRA